MKVLAIDHGEKYLGFALSDELGKFATRLPVVRIANSSSDVATALAVVKHYNPQLLLVGLPSGINFKPTQQSRRVRIFCDKLVAVTGIALKTWEETGSTIAAAKLAKIPARNRLDSESARIILQEYLDYQNTGI